jgi:hypothetical protein
MTTEETLITADDTEGHNVVRFADDEKDETDGATVHMMRGADAEKDETDDTEGHTLGGVFADWESDKKVATQEADVVRP